MTVLASILAVFGVLFILGWLSRHAAIMRESKNSHTLDGNYPVSDSLTGRISVLVAAKDEEHNIGKCLDSLVQQDYPDFEVIVVNDRSTDRTGEIIDSYASQYDCVTALHVETLPPDWMGKNHAMQKAAQVATGDYLLLTDADCVHTSPRALAVSLQMLKDRKVGLLSVLPTLKCKTIWESMIQPICSGVMMIWFDPQKVNDPKKSNAYANGAFMLFDRKVYDAIGQHKAIRNQMQEDMELAKLTKTAGHGLSVIRNEGLYSVRMYTKFSDLIAGWTRIFYGSFPTYTRGMLSLIAIVLMGICPHVVWIVALCNIGAGGLFTAALITGSIAAILQQTAIFRFYKLLGLRAWLCWTYPISTFIVSYILIRAMLKLRPNARVTWKGTAYANAN